MSVAFERNYLFPSIAYKTVISPSSYNKQKYLDLITENYNRQPLRNKWSNVANFHHYYDDWDNNKFEKLDLNELRNLYGNIIDSFMSDQIMFSNVIEYTWNIVNVTASKNPQEMGMHNHLHRDENYTCHFSAIHYMKIGENHSRTEFRNPLIVGYTELTLGDIGRKLSPNQIENSSFFRNWSLNWSEDDFVIFPAYLDHSVPKRKEETEDLRITVACNIYLKLD